MLQRPEKCSRDPGYPGREMYAFPDDVVDLDTDAVFRHPTEHSGEVAGIVLAAGLSRRFGSSNKLLAEVDGLPIVRRTVTAYLDLSPVFVVVGHERDAVLQALRGLPVTPVQNLDYMEGQSRSLVRGVAALPPEVEAAVIGVADQPWLRPDVIAGLVGAWRDGAGIAVPRYAGQRGNPVLFDRRYFPELRSVTGDQGGRTVLQGHPEAVRWVDVPDAQAGLDVDTPQALTSESGEQR